MFRPLLISLFLTSTALATTWTVDDDGKADFDNIQAAVDAASNGDEIIVAPGTYTSTTDEVVDMLGKEVWLHSSKGAGVTTIDGQGARRGILCDNGETSNTIIEGLTITNGYSSEDGGGMYNTGSSPTLTGCIFTGNTADYGEGGGMANNYSGNPTLTDCIFTDNTSYYGGGMYNHSSSPMLENCTFTSNTAISGGGMVNSYSSSTLTNCTFTNNSADQYGGGMANVISYPTLTNCTFTNNSADQHGGGMWNFGNHWVSILTLTNCTFTNNSAIFGGGMLNSNSSSPTLTNTTVCSNSPNQIYGDWTDNGGNTIADVCPVECPDINGDGYVNVTDLLAAIDQWGLTNSPADVNDDGIVDVSDLLIVVGNWGPCE